MQCLSQKQLAEYLAGNKAESEELHLAECRECRTAIVKLRADLAATTAVSGQLMEQTIQKIKEERGTADGGKIVSMPKRIMPRSFVFALAAGIVLALSAVLYFHAGNRVPAISIVKEQARTAAPADARAFDSGSVASTMKMWLDTLKVKDFKSAEKNIAVKQETGTVIRLGRKTGIFAEPMAVIHISDRTDSSISVNLNRGNALFSIEKKKYKVFCVSTPHVRIIVTGTVFSVMVDSIETKVNVMEGAVRLMPRVPSAAEQTVEQGDEAIASADSIAATEIMNRLIAKKRGSMLLDYLQSTVFREKDGTMNGPPAVPEDNP
jgi:hypothetical protein